MSQDEVRQAVERFFLQAMIYTETSLAHGAAFLHVEQSTLLHEFSFDEWTNLRHMWALQHIQQAMDLVYSRATFQSDFSTRRIAEQAGVDKAMIRLLAGDEFLRRKATLPMLGDKDETLSQRVELLFAEATSLSAEIQMGSTQQEADLGMFSREQRQVLQDVQILRRIRQVMEEVYQQAKSQNDFTMERIADQTSVPIGVVRRLARDEILRRKATLPTSREKVMETLRTLVQENMPVNEFTREKICAVAGVSIQKNKWFRQVHHAAYLELAKRQQQLALGSPPSDKGTWISIAGRWVDLDSDRWDLRQAQGRGYILRKDRLRNDFADIAWAVLREDLLAGELAHGTILDHFSGFLQVGVLLGAEIPEIHSASLEAVQQAWVRYMGTHAQRKKARIALLQMVKALIGQCKDGSNQDPTEMIRIAAWLGILVNIPSRSPGEEFLSEEELTSVLQACLSDIQAGIAFTQDSPNLSEMSTSSSAQEPAGPVLHWAIALVILVMAFTGLRRQSVLTIELDDWMQIRHEVFALLWHHGKKREENLVVLPAIIAHHLDLYVARTTEVRMALGTQRVFLHGSKHGSWKAMLPSGFDSILTQFVARHHLEREGALLSLGSTVFRRTFATRAFYEGQSLWALRSQLGHEEIRTTARYIKRDRFEHPGQVRQPLDVYGRQSLTFWHTPQLLEELVPDERARLLNAKVQQDQDVGLCRHDHCTKAEHGSPPPCSLCEHLVTGAEFLPAWEAERVSREQELSSLVATPGAELVLAQMKCQMKQFEVNYTFIRERYVNQ